MAKWTSVYKCCPFPSDDIQALTSQPASLADTASDTAPTDETFFCAAKSTANWSKGQYYYYHYIYNC